MSHLVQSASLTVFRVDLRSSSPLLWIFFFIIIKCDCVCTPPNDAKECVCSCGITLCIRSYIEMNGRRWKVRASTPYMARKMERGSGMAHMPNDRSRACHLLWATSEIKTVVYRLCEEAHPQNGGSDDPVINIHVIDEL